MQLTEKKLPGDCFFNGNPDRHQDAEFRTKDNARRAWPNEGGTGLFGSASVFQCGKKQGYTSFGGMAVARGL